jgi:hypothetical protein
MRQRHLQAVPQSPCFWHAMYIPENSSCIARKHSLSKPKHLLPSRHCDMQHHQHRAFASQLLRGTIACDESCIINQCKGEPMWTQSSETNFITVKLRGSLTGSSRNLSNYESMLASLHIDHPCSDFGGSIPSWPKNTRAKCQP